MHRGTINFTTAALPCRSTPITKSDLTMATSKLRNLTAADFEKLANETSLGDVARAMAREYFVMNRTQTDIATEFGKTKQRVNLALESIRRVHEAKAAQFKTAGVSLNDSVPELIHAPLQEFLSELRNVKSEAKRKLALDQVARALERATWALK